MNQRKIFPDHEILAVANTAPQGFKGCSPIIFLLPDRRIDTFAHVTVPERIDDDQLRRNIGLGCCALEHGQPTLDTLGTRSTVLRARMLHERSTVELQCRRAPRNDKPGRKDYHKASGDV